MPSVHGCLIVACIHLQAIAGADGGAVRLQEAVAAAKKPLFSMSAVSG